MELLLGRSKDIVLVGQSECGCENVTGRLNLIGKW